MQSEGDIGDSEIEVEGLCKVFQVRQRAPGLGAALRSLVRAPVSDVAAVDGISFRIRRGERVAFVGENGAGKSTTLKMLSGILHPSAGHARVAGLTPWQRRGQLGYRIGTVFGQRTQLWYHLPAADTFELLGHVYDRDPVAHRRRLSMLVEAFGIGSHLDKPVRQLSLGERMRCEIVASLLHVPRVLFLDEPTIGLDVSAKAAIRDLVRDESERDGRTIVLTSHDTGDVERVCERMIVIHRGRLLLDRPVAELRQAYIRKKFLTVQTAEQAPTFELPGVSVVARAPHRTELEVDTDVAPVERVLSAILQSARVRDLTVQDPPMEEVVRAIYAGADRALSAASGASGGAP